MRELIVVDRTGDERAELFGVAEALAKHAALPALRFSQELGLPRLGFDPLLHE